MNLGGTLVKRTPRHQSCTAHTCLQDKNFNALVVATGTGNGWHSFSLPFWVSVMIMIHVYPWVKRGQHEEIITKPKFSNIYFNSEQNNRNSRWKMPNRQHKSFDKQVQREKPIHRIIPVAFLSLKVNSQLLSRFLWIDKNYTTWMYLPR